QGFDPAAFVAGAPSATLAIDAVLATAADGVLEGDVAVRNEQAMRVDEGGLPLDSLSTRVRASLQQVSLSEVDVALLGGGRLSGEAQLRLPAELQPLSGSATLVASGIDPSRL